MSKRIINDRRSSIEIVADMLLHCRDTRASKTAIMYAGNLSYEQLGRYLSFLTAKSLLEKDQRGLYLLTPTGKAVLDQIVTLLEALHEVSEEKGGEENGRLEAVYTH